MKGSHKIALVAGAGLLIVLLVYFMGPSGSSQHQIGSDRPPSGGESHAAGREERPHLAQNGSVPPPGTAGTVAGGGIENTGVATATTAGPPSEFFQGTRSGESAGGGLGSASPPSGSFVPPTPIGSSDTTGGEPHTGLGAATPPSPPDREAGATGAARAPAAKTYTIQAGDTFSSIADELYGSGDRSYEISQANPLVDPTKLKIGQVIKLPDLTAPAGSGAPGNLGGAGIPGRAPAVEVNGKVIYVVRPGDTLSTLAQQYYHDRKLWRVIYNANKTTLGNDPDRLEDGMRLVIPPAPQGATSGPVRAPTATAPARRSGR